MYVVAWALFCAAAYFLMRWGRCGFEVPAAGPRRADAALSAQTRAETLLREHLSPAQLRALDAHDGFVVVGGCTGAHYWVRRGSSFNITLSLESAITALGALRPELRASLSEILVILGLDPAVDVVMCAVPVKKDGWLPEADQMLAQKLALETPEGEEEVLRVANFVARTQLDAGGIQLQNLQNLTFTNQNLVLVE